MFRLAVFVALLLLAAVGTTRAGQYGTAEEAKALLEKAVAAVKQDKAKALEMFNKGEGGFKDRDLYVACANASDGVVTAHPYLKGEQLQDIKGKKSGNCHTCDSHSANSAFSCLQKKKAHQGAGTNCAAKVCSGAWL